MLHFKIDELVKSTKFLLLMQTDFPINDGVEW
jgi:hypothetical protein